MAAVAFLGAYAWPILNPSLVAPWPTVCHLFAWLAWGLFAVDLVVRLVMAADRRSFLRDNLLDLAVVALPLLRPLRLLRLVTLLAVLNRHAGHSLRGRVVVYVVGATSLVMVVASLAILDAERGRPGSTIESFGDAVWWSFTTVTTVGYGDRFPVTVQGRAVAVGLMLAGIALLGVVTATFASWLVERVREAGEDSEAVTRRDLTMLTAEVARLRAVLEARAVSESADRAGSEA
ncbi:potassium channel family protein [Petropleomorpha daqingensis]|uniref:potassium channel family protein n=1 Tax=Petropleomorpha daqingensis TaxID=2026353 RepID=UPI001FEC93A0|nr:potassium channel family protein [Petropleomorpha daqingensis]